jgi:hypothetical protein
MDGGRLKGSREGFVSLVSRIDFAVFVYGSSSDFKCNVVSRLSIRQTCNQTRMLNLEKPSLSVPGVFVL